MTNKCVLLVSTVLNEVVHLFKNSLKITLEPGVVVHNLVQLRQGHVCEFKANLVHLAGARPAHITQSDSVSKKYIVKTTKKLH